jgi:hypothetical protein
MDIVRMVSQGITHLRLSPQTLSGTPGFVGSGHSKLPIVITFELLASSPLRLCHFRPLLPNHRQNIAKATMLAAMTRQATSSPCACGT